jgi:phosphate transport system permease protein
VAFTRSQAVRRRIRIRERIIESLLFAAAFSSVAVTVAIVAILIYESLLFFASVSILEFAFTTTWTPLFADPKYGILPLLSGTFVSSLIGMIVAAPIGLIAAIYLSEFASKRQREAVKPTLELLSGVPTVVYGYFALLVITPALQSTILPDLPGFNLLSAGIVIGIMIIPYVASLSEDAMRAVPNSLRDGSFALGASKLQTALLVVLPAATSGVTAALVLGISRAVGETMIVAIAAGQQPNFTLDPTEGAATITAYIVQVSLGDIAHGTLPYQTIFAAGLALLLLTLVFNVIAFYMRKRFREAY